MTACKSNLKNLATACEMYSTDNHSLYPGRLDTLTPNYLKHIPLCPSAQKETYSGSYISCNVRPEGYTIFCEGQFHQKGGLANPNYPQYSSFSGLILP